MKETVQWKVSTFDQLTTSELYSILHLRAQVFVLEQDAPYLDLDYKDQKALHLHGYLEGELAVYCRLFRPGDYFDQACIGRVVCYKKFRSLGLGHQLMDVAVEQMATRFNETEITISAQLYLQKFYESHQFVRVSDMYLEDGIPHIQMKRS